MKKDIGIFTIILIIITIIFFIKFIDSYNQAHSFNYGACLERYADGYVDALADTIGYMLEICPQERENLYQYEIIFGSATIITLLLTILSGRVDRIKK